MLPVVYLRTISPTISVAANSGEKWGGKARFQGYLTEGSLFRHQENSSLARQDP